MDASAGTTRVALTVDLRKLLDQLLESRIRRHATSTVEVTGTGAGGPASSSPSPADLLEQLSSVLQPAGTNGVSDAAAANNVSGLKEVVDKGVPYELVKRLGWWTQTPSGRQALERAELDPSAYHPHSLLSSTTTLLPPSITRPPSAPSNPDVALASSYLPPASQRPARPERSIGQDWSAVGKQFGAVANVLFSAGGVGGGVYWLGGHGHKWSQTKSVLLSLFAFLAVVAVEVALYAIHFSRLERARELDERARERWLKGGLTEGVERVELPLLADGEEGRGDEVSKGVEDAGEQATVNDDGEGELMPAGPRTTAARISLRRRAPGEPLGSRDGR